MKTKALVLVASLAIGGCTTLTDYGVVRTETLRNEQGHVIGSKELLRNDRTGEVVAHVSMFTPIRGESGELIGYEEQSKEGAVIRDLATGFTGGYYARTGSSLNPSVSGTINLNKEWNWDPTYTFQSNTTGTIPTSSGLAYNLYDPYAQVFYKYTDSYGAGYSDNLTRALSVGPLISVANGPNLNADSNDISVTLFADNESPAAG